MFIKISIENKDLYQSSGLLLVTALMQIFFDI